MFPSAVLNLSTRLTPCQTYSTDATLSDHTLFAPKTVPAGVKLPILVWGQGRCAADSLAAEPFLTQLASHGILIFTSGIPKGKGSTTAAQMTAGIDWIVKSAGTGTCVNVDASRIIAAGWSCLGVEAYASRGTFAYNRLAFGAQDSLQIKRRLLRSINSCSISWVDRVVLPMSTSVFLY
ncbi:hypothetical protein DL95DRAFT_457694 [Leptodontidium sp. 2 PMI_412]|nr:hypothetical protein DL95DRAFT_457694 [Leptodontidium sp. 2 PMI_412]